MEDLQKLINEKQGQILAHKAYLKATDYKIIKKYEEYDIAREVLDARAQARQDINILEKEIKELEEIEQTN